MAIYTTKKCPNCNIVYERYSNYTKHLENHSGSPFIICKFCGQTFVDKDIKEPALKPFYDVDFGIIGCVIGLLFPFGVVGIGLTVALFCFEFNAFLLIFAALFDALYIYLVVKSYQSRDKAKEDLRREYEESLERLNDINYAIALKKAGFKVPKEFLNPPDDVSADL